MNRLARLQEAGVSIWLDTLSRELLDSGAFAALIADFAVTGATSHPTIFAKAIDAVLAPGSDLRGRAATANAKRAYGRYRQRFTDQRWRALRDAGAHPQRPLWASTGTAFAD